MIYVAFELIRKILGGSLAAEELLTALVVVNIGLTFTSYRTITKRISKLESKFSSHIGWHKGRESKA
tara:strand:- start:2198 stop:2398 length:201 start_codon:yes stop_codon:yes gene_type:complete